MPPEDRRRREQGEGDDAGGRAAHDRLVGAPERDGELVEQHAERPRHAERDEQEHLGRAVCERGEMTQPEGRDTQEEGGDRERRGDDDRDRGVEQIGRARLELGEVADHGRPCAEQAELDAEHHGGDRSCGEADVGRRPEARGDDPGEVAETERRELRPDEPERVRQHAERRPDARGGSRKGAHLLRRKRKSGFRRTAHLEVSLRPISEPMPT